LSVWRVWGRGGGTGEYGIVWVMNTERKRIERYQIEKCVVGSNVSMVPCLAGV